MTSNHALPVAVIGAGPVGLAAAAHLLERGITPLVLEAGPTPAHAVRAWGHVRLFSPWRYNIDSAARRLLGTIGWTEPDPDILPTGAELVRGYLDPLAHVPALAAAIRTGTRVVAVSRSGLDKTRTANRAQTPFLVRTQSALGLQDHLVRGVIDASGTWDRPNPLGTAGLAAPGEAEARAAGLITAPLPDAAGRDRETFTGQRVLVVGAGHSAANPLLDLAAAGTPEILWAVRSRSAEHVYGGGDMDGLPARGALGTRLRELVRSGTVQLHTSFTITGFELVSGPGTDRLKVTAAGGTALTVDRVVPATGFRPDLDMLAEVRLDLDPAVDAPRQLGPLIDPEFHSCGTVAPHGARMLAHPDPDFYIAGMKSYGRAPTFLMATGYEQVRSIAAALAGDQAAADAVELVLPETGVCSSDIGTSCDTGTNATVENGASSCCAPEPVQSEVAAASSCCAPEPAAAAPSSSCCTPEPAPQPVTLGFPTGLEHGRAGRDQAALREQAGQDAGPG